MCHTWSYSLPAQCHPHVIASSHPCRLWRLSRWALWPQGCWSRRVGVWQCKCFECNVLQNWQVHHHQSLTLPPLPCLSAGVDSRSFGPFTPAAEKLVGRVAMLGFSGIWRNSEAGDKENIELSCEHQAWNLRCLHCRAVRCIMP